MKWIKISCGIKLNHKISTLTDGTANCFLNSEVRHKLQNMLKLQDRQMASFCSYAVTRAYYTSRYMRGMQAMQVSTLCQTGHVLPNMFQVLFKPTAITKGFTTISHEWFPTFIKTSAPNTSETLGSVNHTIPRTVIRNRLNKRNLTPGQGTRILLLNVTW